MKLSFKKYEGTGNDFIMVDDRDKLFPADDNNLVERLCNRRFGIGADGLILLQPHSEADFYMQYFNSDGRESSMCGNGGRCITQFAIDEGIITGKALFYAADGQHQAQPVAVDEDDAALVKLQMIGVEKFETRAPEVFVLDTGSPHYVQFVKESLADFDLVTRAKAIRYNNEFNDAGINVNFVNINGFKQLSLRTYERGVEDETLSCGTGATATALAAAVFNNLPDGDNKVNVNVQGGVLTVEFNFDKEHLRFTDIWLQGPVRKVFSGSVLI